MSLKCRSGGMAPTRDLCSARSLAQETSSGIQAAERAVRPRLGRCWVLAGPVLGQARRVARKLNGSGQRSVGGLNFESHALNSCAGTSRRTSTNLIIAGILDWRELAPSHPPNLSDQSHSQFLQLAWAAQQIGDSSQRPRWLLLGVLRHLLGPMCWRMPTWGMLEPTASSTGSSWRFQGCCTGIRAKSWQAGWWKGWWTEASTRGLVVCLFSGHKKLAGDLDLSLRRQPWNSLFCDLK